VAGLVDGRGHDLTPPGLDHDAAVGLLLERRPDHVDLALQAEEGGRQRQGAPPLAGARLRAQPPHPLGRVVERLGHGRVGLVRPGRRYRLVLVVDAGGCVQGLLEPPGPDERGGPPQPKDVDHLAGHVDPRLGGHLLGDQGHGEQRGQVVGPDGLACPRVQRRLERRRQVRHHVEPRLGKAVAGQGPTGRGHRSPLSLRAGLGTVRSLKATSPGEEENVQASSARKGTGWSSPLSKKRSFSAWATTS
jgi:hypothetical protein